MPCYRQQIVGEVCTFQSCTAFMSHEQGWPWGVDDELCVALDGHGLLLTRGALWVQYLANYTRECHPWPRIMTALHSERREQISHSSATLLCTPGMRPTGGGGRGGRA